MRTCRIGTVRSSPIAEHPQPAIPLSEPNAHHYDAYRSPSSAFFTALNWTRQSASPPRPRRPRTSSMSPSAWLHRRSRNLLDLSLNHQNAILRPPRVSSEGERGFPARHRHTLRETRGILGSVGVGRRPRQSHRRDRRRWCCWGRSWLEIRRGPHDGTRGDPHYGSYKEKIGADSV